MAIANGSLAVGEMRTQIRDAKRETAHNQQNSNNANANQNRPFQTQWIPPANGLSSQANRQQHRRGSQAKRQHGGHTAADTSRAGGGRARDIDQPARQQSIQAAQQGRGAGVRWRNDRPNLVLTADTTFPAMPPRPARNEVSAPSRIKLPAAIEIQRWKPAKTTAAPIKPETAPRKPYVTRRPPW